MAKKRSPATDSDIPKGMRTMEDLHRLLAKQDFNSKDEIEAFMQRMKDEGIPEFIPDGAIEEAEELVLQGYESETPRAMELAREALELDHECIGAYDLLGRCESLIPVRIAYFKRGVDLGSEIFDDLFIKENPGEFWAMHETRPYMRCLQGYAECLYYLGDPHGALEVWIDMIDLNPSDNLGIRQYLLLGFACLGMEQGFKEIDQRYKDDAFSSTLYNRAFMAFVAEKKNADKLLRDALKLNPHIADQLMNEEPPDNGGIGAVTLGSVEEAMGYTAYGWGFWRDVPGCMAWLERVANSARSKAK